MQKLTINSGNLQFEYYNLQGEVRASQLDLITLVIEREVVENKFPQCRKTQGGLQLFIPTVEFFDAFSAMLVEKFGFDPISRTTANGVWSQSYTQAEALKKNTSETLNSQPVTE